MNKKYILLLIFVIFMIMSFNEFANNIRKKIIIIIYFIYMQFNSIYKIIKYKISKKKFTVHPCKLTKKLNSKLIRKENSFPIRKEKCIYLFNHRSWADFWIDYDIVGGACYISRKLLKYVLGFIGILGEITEDIIYFDRKDKKDKYNLYEKILKKINNRNIIVYPEGTRNTKNVSIPLKLGIIKLAYENNIPLQIIINNNKEKIFSQKKLLYFKNINSTYYVSEVIFPINHKTLEEFINFVQIKWDESWNQIY